MRVKQSLNRLSLKKESPQAYLPTILKALITAVTTIGFTEAKHYMIIRKLKSDLFTSYYKVLHFNFEWKIRQ